MTPHVLTFAESGEGHCLYTEAIELGAIGRLTLWRATAIEFDAASQHWEVRDAGTPVAPSCTPIPPARSASPGSTGTSTSR